MIVVYTSAATLYCTMQVLNWHGTTTSKLVMYQYNNSRTHCAHAAN
jgi:hypothetical protein